MPTKYMTYRGDSKIEVVDVLRETKQCVFLPVSRARGNETERRESKRGEYTNYFDTWDEARAHLLDRAEVNLRTARLRLEAAQSRLGNIKGLKKPAVTA